jgi:hypothetical protein
MESQVQCRPNVLYCVTVRHAFSRSSMWPSAHKHYLFALLVQPPISPRTSCPTNTERITASIERKYADHATMRKNASIVENKTWCGFGVLHGMWREPPENWDGGGAKRVEERGRRDSRCRLLVFRSLHIYTPRFSSL